MSSVLAEDSGNSKTLVGYTGHFKIKYVVQQRQWRHWHHAAAALFRYMREYAVQFRSHYGFVCLDGKLLKRR